MIPIEETYINLWSRYTTTINNETWYITDLYCYEMEDLNITFGKNVLCIDVYTLPDGYKINTVWIHEKLLDLLYLKCQSVTNNDKIKATEELYQAAYNILKSHYDNA